MEVILAFLAEYGVELGGAAAGLAIIETVFKPFRRIFGRTETVKLDEETKEALAPTKAKDGPALTIPEFIRLRRELKADLEDELTRADETEKTQLRARIAELESQIANPDKSLAEAKKRITDLEALLDRAGNDIGGDRINEAKAALEQGDYSLADDIFAEIEARNDMAVQESARAAYGRGEVAEAEVRWADAADHYERASELSADYDALYRATHLLQLAGQYERASVTAAKLVAQARELSDDPKLSSALDRHATVLQRRGQFGLAETGFREALEIDRATIGETHPAYASGLNNLAMVVDDQGRFADAEELYRQALKIDRATIGETHPTYAIHLNNLGGVVQNQGRFAEAEELYRQGLEIDRATIGEAHPGYAIHINNLALVVQAQGRFEAARPLFQQALVIFQATLPADHPNIALLKQSIASLPSPPTEQN
jgi:tetratricopeptide (TPR) repeat protein